MKLEFSRQIFEKISSIRFHENRPMRVELFRVDRQTDGHDETSSRFSQFLQTCLKGGKLFVSLREAD